MLSQEVECVWKVGAVLGEGPMWSATDRTLWFVDIKGHRIHSYAADTGATRSFATPDMPAFIFAHRDGGMICGMRTGLFRFDPAAERFDRIIQVDAEHPSNRLNDGYVDAAGRLWFGTMDNEHRATTGSLYCFQHDRLQRKDAGYVITNGPAMSPDGRTLYHVDTLQRLVYAFDVDAAGGIGNRRVFATVEDPGFYPDGPTVDASGNVWIALFGGWGVRCYSPAGEVIGSIAVPAAQCTKVAFGGDDLTTMYITTATVGLSAEQLAQQPLAGGLFRTRVATPGLPTRSFAG